MPLKLELGHAGFIPVSKLTKTIQNLRRTTKLLNLLTNSDIATGITIPTMILCTIVSLFLGLIVAFIHMKTSSKYNKNFIVTLVLLPIIVQLVIMVVNGNIGAGVAVAGAFSLVRFRSIPGTSRDITSVFMAMAIGLVTGMGFLFYGIIFVIIVGIVNLILANTKFGESKEETRILKITIPESLDYEGIFKDIFEEHLIKSELDRIKTTNMGSLFELSYTVIPKNLTETKKFLDDIRIRNGNLQVSLSRDMTQKNEL
jgi:uncharacterized membrane protein YhiD involved in acid resistance